MKVSFVDAVDAVAIDAARSCYVRAVVRRYLVGGWPKS